MNVFKRVWQGGLAGLSRTSANAAINLFDKVVRRGTDAIVLIYLARSVNPEQFGLWSYVSSTWVVMSAFCGLGLQFTATRAFATAPSSAHPAIAANAICLRLIGTLGSALVLAVFLRFNTRPMEGAAFLCAVIACGVVAQAWDTVDHRLQGGDGYPSVVLARLTAAALGIPLKVIAIWLGFGVLGYSVVSSVEFSVVAILFWHLRANRPKPTWSDVDLDGMTILLRRSWPFIGTGIATAIYTKADQLLLGTFMGLGNVGLYSAVVRIAEIWHFVPAGITTVWASYFYALHARDPESARQTVAAAHRVGMRGTAIVVGLLFLFADPLIRFCYGDTYDSAVPALRIYVFSSFFVVSGLITWLWMVSEDLSRDCLNQTLFGAVTSVAANLFLIPRLGIVGAAIAMVVSQFAANLLFHALNRRTRHILMMQLRSV